MTSPPFDPRITTDATGTVYEDGRMYAMVEVWDKDGRQAITIHEWTSHDPSKGHSQEALRWMKRNFAVVVASGIGELDEDGVGDISTSYWAHMRAKGLADILLLDDGTELAADWGTDPAPSPGR